MSVFKEVFESFGFSPLQTPALEKIEVLKGADYGEDNLATIFNFTGPEKVEMALRFELTASLARFVAGNHELPLPFRRYQFAPVWRVDKPGFGRYREFTQFDIDSVGTASMLADAEIMAAICKSFEKLNLPNYKIRFSNRKILNGLAKMIGIPVEKAPDVFRVIDKLEKQGLDAVIKELGAGRIDKSGDKIPGLNMDNEHIILMREYISVYDLIVTAKHELKKEHDINVEISDDDIANFFVNYNPTAIRYFIKREGREEGIGLGEEQSTAIRNFLTIKKEDQLSVLRYAWSFMVERINKFQSGELGNFGDNKSSEEIKCVFDEGIKEYSTGLFELNEIRKYLEYLNVPEEKTIIDITVVRGLGYYTGPVFETYLDDVPEIGSVFSGGRYDSLVARFSGKKMPAVGASAGVDRLLAALLSKKLISADNTVSEVLVTAMDSEFSGEYIKILNEIRDAGIKAEIFLGETRNFTKQVKYADRIGVPIAVILGSEEFENGQITIKNLIAGREQAKEVSDREEWLKAENIQVTIDRKEMIDYLKKLLSKIKS